MKRSEVEHSSPWRDCPACKAALDQLTTEHQTRARVSDSQALDLIAQQLSADEFWNAGTLDAVADIVQLTGRTI